ncbi:MAG: hypothetical protein HYZ14_01275 [Bacteroidetes bacterium]|nr:hypothetical protein [Bacteroidota bacterium]
MKYLIITGVFIVGMSLGYVVGTRSAFSVDSGNPDQMNQVSMVSSDKSTSKNDRELNAAESTLEQMQHEYDSTDAALTDSTLIDLMLLDSTLEDENISTEKLIKTISIPVVYLTEETSKDTAMQDLLGIDEVKINALFVEFWESPLNFEGYKLSRKKLIVYGLSSQFDYKLYKDGSSYFLACQNIYYKMKETQDFLPFVEVSKSDVFHD